MKFETAAPFAPAEASHPARGAWIEIMPYISAKTKRIVAPRKGCVD